MVKRKLVGGALVVVDTDRQGRTVEGVYVATLDVIRELVRQGAARVYRQYLHDRTPLAVEAEAMVAPRELWSL